MNQIKEQEKTIECSPNETELTLAQHGFEMPGSTYMWIFSIANATVLHIHQFSSLSHVQLCDPMDCSTPDFPVHHQLPNLAQTHVHQVSDAIEPSHPLLSPSPPAFNLSQHQGLFKRVSPSPQVAKYWSFSFSTSLPNEYSGLISFTIDWFDLIAVQGTLKSLLQHHSSKASILQHSAFFIVELISIHDYQKNHSFD